MYPYFEQVYFCDGLIAEKPFLFYKFKKYL